MTARRDLLLAGAIVILGIFLALGALQINAGFGYDRIGPRAAPYLVALGFVLLGSGLAVAALGDRSGPERNAPPPIRWKGLGLLALAGLLFLGLVGQVGFIVAASLQFWLVARAFSPDRPLRDATVAATLSLVVYISFARGLALPASVVESLF